MMKSPWIPKLSGPTSSSSTHIGRYIRKQRKKKALNSKLKALDMKSRMRDAFAEPSYIATASRPFFKIALPQLGALSQDRLCSAYCQVSLV